MMGENTGAGDAWLGRSWYRYDSLSRQIGTWREGQKGLVLESRQWVTTLTATLAR